MNHLTHDQLQNLGINISVIVVCAYLVIWSYRQFKRHNYRLGGQILSVIAAGGFYALVIVSLSHPQIFPIALLASLAMIEYDRRSVRGVEVLNIECEHVTLTLRGVAKKSPNEGDELVPEPELD